MLRFLIALLFLSVAHTATAISIEAEGRALIYNRDLDSARQHAINQASQQALLQAGAFVTSRQRVKDGILMTDHLQVQMRGSLSNVRVLSEQVEGDEVRVRIRADVITDESCAQSDSGRRYGRSIAITGFPLAHPQQANLGGFNDASRTLSSQLVSLIGAQPNLRTLNASHLNMHPNPGIATTHQQANGNLTDNLPALADLDVQFVVSGIVRDLSMYQPDRDNEGNILRNWYDQVDHRGRQHLRNFAIDLFIHDGFTGALLFNRSYRVGGLWETDRHQRTGFMTPAFLTTDYGHKVRELLQHLSTEVIGAVECEPFSTRIVSTDGNRVTFNAGSVNGVRPGDMLRVYRRSTQFDPNNQPYTRLEDTRATLVVNEVHPLFSTGNLGDSAAALNIQQDDLLMTR